jgi:hypothetical protein
VYLGTKAPAETQPRGLKEGAGTNGAGSNGGPAGIQAVMEGWVAQLETPAAEGVSFPALFGVAMTIGALSRCVGGGNHVGALFVRQCAQQVQQEQEWCCSGLWAAPCLTSLLQCRNRPHAGPGPSCRPCHCWP